MDICSEPLHPRAAEGLRLFNAGRYFESHEALEDAWNAERGEIRDLYRGLLQTAVVYLHVTRRNYAGALKVFDRSRRWLDRWPDRCRGIHVGRLRTDLSALIESVGRLSGAGETPDAALLRPIEWDDSPAATARRIVCDRCGHVMRDRNCKVICSNCGNFFDCSDLNVRMD